MTVTETRTIKELPPEMWLGGCMQYLPEAKPDVTNAGELAEVPGVLTGALLQCDKDIENIRQWRNQQ